MIHIWFSHYNSRYFLHWFIYIYIYIYNLSEILCFLKYLCDWGGQLISVQFFYLQSDSSETLYLNVKANFKRFLFLVLFQNSQWFLSYEYFFTIIFWTLFWGGWAIAPVLLSFFSKFCFQIITENICWRIILAKKIRKWKFDTFRSVGPLKNAS